MRVRQDTFIKGLLSQQLPSGSKVLVVSHGAFIKAWVSNMCDIPIDDIDKIVNCSVTGIAVEVDDSDGTYTCKLVEGGLNCHAHQITGTAEARELEFEGGNKD